MPGREPVPHFPAPSSLKGLRIMDTATLVADTVEKKGVITYIEPRPNGYVLRLNSRTWVYVDTGKLKNIETLIKYGNTITVFGIEKYNGRKEILYASNLGQIRIFHPETIIKKFGSTGLTNVNFLAYLYTFKRSLYNKFIRWPVSRQSSYSMNPYRLYLNGHLDYHTAKALADVTSVTGKEHALPAIIRYLLEEALYSKQNYTLESLHNTIASRYPDVTISDIIGASKAAQVTIQGNSVTLNSVLYMKQKCLDILKDNLSTDSVINSDIERTVPEFSKYLCWKYFCVTGSGGSGKSTLVMKLKDIPGIVLAATTGKAAQRLGVSTIHSLLGFGPKGFSVKQLPASLLILDEASMLDWRTLMAVLKAVPRVIFVGDIEQLPPVEGESVFRTLTAMLPVYNLTSQWRQTDHSIVQIEKLNYIGILNLYKRHLPSIQIITPLVVGPYGTEAINSYIHQSLHGTTRIIPGTPVIIDRNIYSGGVLVAGNGTTGTIGAVDGNFYMVKTENGKVWVTKDDFSLAYALTVHRCQGSEWNYVLFLLPSATVREGLITEELKEVAMTRARIRTYVAKV